MNLLVLKGKVTTDVIYKMGTNGTPRATFLVVDYRNKKAQTFSIVAFGQVAERASKMVKKRQEILVHGPVSLQTWVDPNGEEKSRLDVVANYFELYAQEKDDTNEPTAYDFTIDGDNDLPF